MIKYDINKRQYEHLGEFSVRESNGKLVAYMRVKDLKTGEVSVMKRVDFLLKGLPQEETESEEVAPAPVDVEPAVVPTTKDEQEEYFDIVEEAVNLIENPVVDTETETAPVVEYVATHTRTKEEVLIEGQDGLDSFIEKHKLESEAVEAMLEGKQNTHKKWRVTKK